MSEKNVNANLNPDNNGANTNGNQDGEQKTKKGFFLVRWGKKAWNAGKEFVDEVKDHPVIAGILAFGGAAAGGAATYAVLKHNQPVMPDPVYAPPMIEGELKDEQEETTETEESPNADYVDVPERD